MRIDSGTATLGAAAVSAAVAFVVLLINLRQNSKLETIHVLVNARLDKALIEIETLKMELALVRQSIKAKVAAE